MTSEPGPPETDAPSATADDGILPKTRTGWKLVLLVLLVALGGRAFAVLESAGWWEPRTDAAQFDHTASWLVNGEGYGYAIVPPNTLEQQEPTALRAPLFPFTLAAVYAVFGDRSWTMGRLLNAGIGTMVVALLGVVAAQLWSRRLGFVAMVIAAGHPALIVIGSSLQLEPLFVTCMLGALAAALEHRRRPRGWRWPIVAGVLAGMMILTRETGFLVLPPLAWLIWTAGPDGRPIRIRQQRPALTGPLLLIGCAAAVVIPWTVRNAFELREFVPVTTSSGIGLSGTYNETSMNDSALPAGWREPWRDPDMAEIMRAMDDPTEAEADRRLRSASLDVIKENPHYLLKAAVWNTQRLFDLDGGSYTLLTASAVPYSKNMLTLGILGSYLLYVLALVGGIRHRAAHARVPKAVWWIPLLLYPFFVVLLPGSMRYRYMLEPFLILLAVPLVAGWLDAYLRRRERRTQAAAAT